MTTWILLSTFFLYNCTTQNDLATEATIIQQPNCDTGDNAVILVDIETGEAPYIIQVVRASDNQIVYSNNVDDNSLEISLSKPLDIDYKIIVKSSNFQVSNMPITILPIGHSELKTQVLIEGTDGLVPFPDVVVDLYVNDYRSVVKFSSLKTDRNGNVSFGDLPSGTYMLDLITSDKYINFELESYDQDGLSIIEEGTSSSVNLPLVCDTNMNLELVFRKQ